MLDRKRLTHFGQGGAMLLFTAFLALSLVGYDPADAPGSSVYPPVSPPRNPCGPVGALLAHSLQQTMGMAAYVLLFGVFVRVCLWIAGRRIPEVGLRLLGFGMLVIVVATGSRRFAPELAGTPPIGSGGYLGAAVLAVLEGQFGFAGMLLIVSALGVAGLVLCHDVLFVWPIREMVRLFVGRRSNANPVTVPHSAVFESTVPSGPAALTYVEPAHARLAAPRSTMPRPDHVAAEFAPISRPLPGPIPSARAVLPNSSPVPVLRSDGDFVLPPFELLEEAPPFPIQEHEAKIHARALLLEKTLLEFGCQVRVVQIDTGPVITQFEIELEAGLRVAKINSVANDLAIALAVPSVRIVSPIPGKTTVGIEVPNDRRGMVRLGEVLSGVRDRLAKLRIPLFLGKDVKGMPLAFDLADMPHLLIAGRTGTGKSVCLNAMIISILMTRRPDEVKLILIDPKMVELSQFKRIPHLMHPVVTDMKKAEALLSWACDKMDERYGYLARAGVRNIQSYNALGADEIYERLRPEDEEERKRIPTYMPYIVIIADEMADLMMTAAKEVESHIVRLAQKARAVGMHLIVATQKPTVDVITGLIKGNLPARIAFQVASRGDSRVVLDEMGADKLLGNGDMLFLVPGTSHIVRAQGTYVSDSEVNKVCDHLAQYPVEFSRELIQLKVAGGPGKERGEGLKERDDLYEAAIEIVIREGRGSCSLLQRALGIGYGRAARLIDFMAEDGIVGEYKSGSAREVLYTWEEWESMKEGGGDALAGGE
ncbi:MAG: DNA translocase FtsK [Isosphaeraceae bacterium]|nr:DNA translocase FtsK [Isosphaeraceae bacterium]